MNIYARSTWTHRPGAPLVHVDWKGKRRPIRVHHTTVASPTTTWTVAMEKAHMRSLEERAVESGDYKAIPYSYVIFPSGRVYEGRGFEKVGGHTLGHNEDIGVAFAGNHEIKRLGLPPRRAFLELRRKLSLKGAAAGANIMHRATFATLCPGKYVVAVFKLKNLGV